MYLISGYKPAQITAELNWYCFYVMAGINMGIHGVLLPKGETTSLNTNGLPLRKCIVKAED